MKTPNQGTGPKQQALRLMQRGRFDQARELCEKLCRTDRADGGVYYLLGSVYGQLGEYQKAIAAFRQSLALQPDTFLTYKGLGAALVMQGEFAEAENTFRHALTLQPGNPEVLLKLAVTLDQLKRAGESEECLRQVLGVKPDSGAALDALGDIRYQKKQYQEAADYYKRALQVEPDRIDSSYRLGHCLQLLGQPDEALKYLEKTLGLDPGHLDALTAMGNAYLSKGDPDRAAETFRKIKRIEPENPMASIGEIVVLERAGDLQAVYEHLLPAVGRGIEHPDLADLYLKVCRIFDCCDEAVRYAERVLDRVNMSSEIRGRLHFSMGRVLDSLGEFDVAFSHYQRANSEKQQDFDAIVHAGTVEAIINVFNWQAFTSAPRATVRSSRPVFIVGMPRSGTTLMEHILASHPDVYGAGELWNIYAIAEGMRASDGRQLQYPFNCTKLTAPMLDSIARRYLRHLDELSPEAVRVTDKLPINFFYLGLIALAFPDARVIHCMRDPRDTCLSIYFQEFSASHAYFNNLKHIGLYYRDYQKLMQHFKALLDIPMLEVCYEDLVTDQESTSRELIEFVGLDWDARCLAFHETSRFVTTPAYDQVRKPMYSSSVGRWKHYEKHLGPLLQALGCD